MRIIVMFDLPTTSTKHLQSYRAFVKNLVKNGFVMMQESIYIKLVLSPTACQLVKNQIKKLLPPEGLIQVLAVTEKQFNSMELLSGELNDTFCISDKRIIEL